MSDASLGVTNPGYREGDTATALPAGIALGASFNPALARQSGGMLGRETNRHWLDAIIDPAAHRESDLSAFEIAIERAQPGSVMTGYNKINGEYAGGNSVLIQDVLKGAWCYPGWVMSDWVNPRVAPTGVSNTSTITAGRGHD